MSTDGVPQKQKAWQVVRRGNPSEAVVLNSDAPVPSNLGQGEVLVKVYAGALNPVGHKMMKIMPSLLARRPHVAEHDISGTIVDPNGSNFQKGDQVFGWIPMLMSFKTGQGALSQYTRLPADHLTHKPTAISFTQAAGISLAGLTAYQALEQAKIEAGQTIFVNGGTTSVGSFAIQIAKAKGCKVVSSCSTANVEKVKSLGADEVMDYKTTPISPHLQENPPTPKFHVIFDTVGSSAELFTSSPAYLAPNGAFVSVGISNTLFDAIVGLFKTTLWPVWLGGTNRQHKVVAVRNNREDLDALRSLIEEGKVQPQVDSVYGFEDVHKAYERSMTGRATGKIIVAVVA